MTDTTHPTQPLAPDPPPSRRLHRSRSDRVLGGVAGGLGRHFDVDPVVFRITLAGLAFVGGFGVFVYLAALAFVPVEGEERTAITRSRVLTVLGAIVLGIATLSIIGGESFFYGPLIALALLAGGGYATLGIVRRRAEGGQITAGRVAVWVAVGAGAPLLLVALAVGSAYAAAEGSGAVVAGVVIAVGVLLAASALRGGGARWLAVPGLVIAVPLGVVCAADVSFDGGYGKREYRPATLADLPAGGHRLGAGALRLDLRDVAFPTGRETVVPVRVGMGYAEVVLPAGVCAVTDTRLGGGYMSLRGREAGGLDVDYRVIADAGAAPRVRVAGDVGLGAIEVVDRPEADFGEDGDIGPGPDRDLGAELSDERADDGACSRVEIAGAR